MDWVERIGGLGRFGFLHASEIEELVSAGVRLEVGEGEPLFHEGDAADAFYIIVRGFFSVQKGLEDGGTLEVAVLEPGAIVGEMGVVDAANPVRSAGVVAVMPGSVLKVPGAHLMDAVESGRAWAAKLLLHFARVLSRRLSALDAAYAELWEETHGRETVEELEQLKARLFGALPDEEATEGAD